MKIKTLLIPLLGFVFLHASAAQQGTIKLELKEYIKQRVDEGVNPSVVMAFIENGTTDLFNYGYYTLNGKVEANENSVYEIGSISKVFTCILLADEVLKGNMKLEDPISKYLSKSVNVPSRNGEEITLKDLATHTSSLPRLPSNLNINDVQNPYADYTVDLLYEFLNNYQLPRDIGSQYEYSNLGMGLLGHILEIETGKTYERLIIDRIANPLKMDDTRVRLNSEMKKRLAMGHNEAIEVTKNWDIPVLSGAGALRSTLADMIKFIKANMNDDGSDLYKAMKLSHQVHFESGDFKIGLGWHYSNDDTITWHNGGTGGYRAFAGFVEETKQGAIALTNSTYSVDGVALVQLGQELDLTMPKKPNFPEIAEVSDDILETYVGEYQLMPQFVITISKMGNQLIAKPTGQPEFEIYPSSENEFFLKVVEATITFNKSEDDKVESMTLVQNGQNLIGKKIK